MMFAGFTSLDSIDRLGGGFDGFSGLNSDGLNCSFALSFSLAISLTFSILFAIFNRSKMSVISSGV